MTIHPSIPHAEYLSMPALSVSGMKQLLPPSCPALFKHYRENRRPDKHAYDIGHVAHGLILGDGPEVVVIDAADWRTKAVKDQRDAAYAEGKVPVLTHEYEQCAAMAAAVRSNRVADALLSNGKPEQTLTWTDPTGVPMRARVDWLPNKRPGVRFTAVDVKTTGGSAHPTEFARTAAKFEYVMQARHYLDGIKACGLDDDPAFVLVVVETSAPHLVSLHEFSEDDLQIASEKIAEAVNIYRGCMESGIWPGYSPDIETIEMPAWYRIAHEQAMEEEMSL
jgi:hypothetical protein